MRIVKPCFLCTFLHGDGTGSCVMWNDLSRLQRNLYLVFEFAVVLARLLPIWAAGSPARRKCRQDPVRTSALAAFCIEDCHLPARRISPASPDNRSHLLSNTSPQEQDPQQTWKTSAANSSTCTSLSIPSTTSSAQKESPTNSHSPPSSTATSPANAARRTASSKRRTTAPCRSPSAKWMRMAATRGRTRSTRCVGSCGLWARATIA